MKAFNIETIRQASRTTSQHRADVLRNVVEGYASREVKTNAGAAYAELKRGAGYDRVTMAQCAALSELPASAITKLFPTAETVALTDGEIQKATRVLNAWDLLREYVALPSECATGTQGVIEGAASEGTASEG